MASDPSSRARDKDRDDAVELVEAAFSDGQLSAPDRDLRVERLRQADTLGDIDGYVRDLQGRDKPARVARPAPSTRVRPPRAGSGSCLKTAVLVAFVLVVAAIGLVTGVVSLVRDLTSGFGGSEGDHGSTRVVSVVVHEEYVPGFAGRRPIPRLGP